MPQPLSGRVTALRSAAQHDKQIKAIRELLHEGMRLMVETRKDMRDFRRDLRELTNSLKRSANGHAKGKVDIH